jgi:membrane fusion protein, multidrug efflux system
MKNILFPIALLSMAACSPGENQDPVPPAKEIRVTTVTVKKEKIVSALRYSGTLEAYQSIPLNFQTTGTVKTVLVEAGDKVRSGQVVATLDPTDSKSMYDIALSQYEQAKDAYNRLKSVYDKGSLPEIKWVEMESKLEQARSSLDLAKNNLAKCELHSPVNGMVGRRNIEPGMSSISLAAASLELVDIRQVYVKISVPENEVARIVKGMKAKFTVSALDDRIFEGRVASVSPVADRISRTYEARILVENPGMVLKPGMVCDVNMEQVMERELTVVPYQSVSKDSKNDVFVYVIKPGGKQVRKQRITTGQYHDAYLEVVSGLTAGDVIVNEGKEKLNDNSLIAY